MNKSTVEKVDAYFQRCGCMSGYKTLIYLKNKASLEVFTNNVLIPLTDKHVKKIAEYMNNGIDYSMVNFENGSNLIACTMDGDVSIVGEKCHALIVDSKIREKELLDANPRIDAYQLENKGMMINPKPIYINLQ